MAFNSQTMAEIKRKAQAGIKLTNPTSQSMAEYNKYKPVPAQAAKPTAVGGVSQAPSTSATGQAYGSGVTFVPGGANGHTFGSARPGLVGTAQVTPKVYTPRPNERTPGLSPLVTEPIKLNPQGRNAYTATGRGDKLLPGAAPGTVASARGWVENSRPGGMANYEAIQRDRYRQAVADRNTEEINKLNADSVRLGYSLSMTDVAADATQAPPEPDYSWITDMVNNELATQKTGIEQELARLKQESELAVNQNNTFLQDQMKNLEENRIKVGNEIVNFQNRRGGFYSGGVDFQQAHNNEVYGGEEGKTTRDIGARNADIWGRNNLLAQQAAENLAKLESQAPDRIRQLIEEQKARDAEAARADAPLTGEYLGKPTVAAQTLAFNQNLDTQKFELDQTKNFTDQQQQEIDNLWNLADYTGVIPNQLADMFGIKRGTPTQQAKQFAMNYSMDERHASISQQNANTSAANSGNTAANANFNRLKAVWAATGKAPKGLEPWGIQPGTPYNGSTSKKSSYKDNPNWSAEIADLNKDPEGQYNDYLAHSQDYMADYGYDGYEELLRQAKAVIDSKK